MSTRAPVRSASHWLPLLRKAHAIIDAAANVGLEHMARTQGGTLACRSGCAHCCRGVIPVSAPELAGAFMHMTACCSGADQARIRQRLVRRPLGECPFVLDGKCAVYPLRFFACRQFFMFGAACMEDEDVWATRRQDIPRPGRQEKLRAFGLLATLYGVTAEFPAPRTFLDRFIRDVSAPLHLWDLSRPETIIASLDQGRLRYSGPGLAA